ncbi:MAG: pseudouridine synthase [Nitrospinaceae bacterium]
MSVRLQKIIADAGLASRREAERLIAAGKVSLNGRVVRQLGVTADPAADQIKVGGRVLPKAQRKIYLLFHKPRGCLTTVTDDRGRRTVMDYFKKFPVRVVPVGRLDYNTDGLLLFTNDGNFSRQLLHPRSQIPRTYRVKVHGLPDAKDLKRLSGGMWLDGQRCAPMQVEVERSTGRNSFLILTLVEGKYRHVRRVCEKVGHPVVKLTRIGFGNLTLSGLPLETFRFLTPLEVKGLRKMAAVDPKTDAA